MPAGASCVLVANRNLFRDDEDDDELFAPARSSRSVCAERGDFTKEIEMGIIRRRFQFGSLGVEETLGAVNSRFHNHGCSGPETVLLIQSPSSLELSIRERGSSTHVSGTARSREGGLAVLNGDLAACPGWLQDYVARARYHPVHGRAKAELPGSANSVFRTGSGPSA